jgi:hypothetical protein
MAFRAQGIAFSEQAYQTVLAAPGGNRRFSIRIGETACDEKESLLSFFGGLDVLCFRASQAMEQCGNQ